MVPGGEALVEVGRYLKGRGYQFVTVTPATHRLINGKPGHKSAILASIFGWSRWVRIEEVDQTLLELLETAEVIEFKDGFARVTVRFSTLGDQLFVHSAYPTESEDSVFFGPDTYRYCRAIRYDIANLPPKDGLTILDLGCGCGVGGLYATHLLGARRGRLTLSDINPEAIRYCAVNAALNGMPNVRLSVGDLFERIDEPVDYIVCNPPFMVDAAKRPYRDGGGDIGAELSLRILKESLSRLNSGGRLLLYTASPVIDGEHLFFRLAKPALEQSGLLHHYEEIDPDIFGEELQGDAYRRVDRLAAVLLTVSVRNQK
jgi:methylase of polypeptide subunit release factors